MKKPALPTSILILAKTELPTEENILARAVAVRTLVVVPFAAVVMAVCTAR
jgi:hypothetical protein